MTSDPIFRHVHDGSPGRSVRGWGRRSSPSRWRQRALEALAGAFLVGLVSAATLFAQVPDPAPNEPVIARVEGRAITQADYDRVAIPYFARLKEQLGGTISEDIQKFANWSVLNELVRRELLVIESQRRGISVTEDETDRVLGQDPLFYTNGKLDRAKFVQFKISPNSNYLNILPKLRELAAANKLDSLLRAQFTPSRRTVQGEWSKRNARVQFDFFTVTARDVSLDPEATRDELETYFRDHAEEFERNARAQLRYVRMPLPPATDTSRTRREVEVMAEGRVIADSLAAGRSLDEIAAAFGGALDTGLFDLPPVAIPGIGRVEALNAQLATVVAADPDSVIAVGPVVTPAGVVVGVITDRLPRQIPSLLEVMPDVKRRADAEKKRLLDEEALRAFFEANRERYRSPRATVTRASLSDLGVRPRRPSASAIRRWYAERGRALFPGFPPGAPLPELSDSLRDVVTRRIEAEDRSARAQSTLSRLARDWANGRELNALARSARAEVETLSVVDGFASDPIFPAAYLDSLLADAAVARVGEVQGPRSFGDWAVVWRVDERDSDFVPAFDAVRTRIEEDLRRDRQAQDEAAARVFFEQRREEYTTPERWIAESISFPIPPPDTMVISARQVEDFYQDHIVDYAQDEQVRARHILISSDPQRTAGGEPAAKARIDSLHAALESGADFALLAMRFSQDPGSAGKGGDLGFFGRGRMVKEFSDTSFALPVGRLSQPVKTSYGFHLIRVEERQESGVRPMTEVRGDIERQLKLAFADSAARLLAESVRVQIARGVVPAALAAPYGGVATSARFAKNEAVPGLGFVQGLSEAIESLEVGAWANQIFRAGNAYVALRVKERFEPGLAEFDEVKLRVVQDMKTAERDSVLAVRADQLDARLRAGASLDSMAAPYGGLKDSGLLARNAGFVPYLGNEPGLVTRAFELPAGKVSERLATAQGFAWIRVAEKTATEGASYENDRTAIEQELLLQRYNEWVEKTKKTVRLQILRQDLVEPPPLTRTVTVGGGS